VGGLRKKPHVASTRDRKSKIKNQKSKIPLALSTAWYPGNDSRIAPTLRAIQAMGFEAVEIGVTRARFRLKKVQKLLKKLSLEVVSVHNVCAERKLEPENLRGDWLGSPDPEKRREGVEATLEAIENAKALGASAVILHMGSPPIAEKWQKQALAYRLVKDGAQAAAGLGVTMDELLAERQGLAPSHIEAACASLSELLERSSGVKLGIECRMGWHELPNIDELALLLDRFPDPRLGYWHDVGHAVLQDFMGLANQYEWLRRFGDRTLGIHFHDVTQGVRDHYPPGLGNVDFEPLLELLPSDALLVMEIAPRFLAEEVEMGRKRLEEIGFCD